jgi:hypothetical protein
LVFITILSVITSALETVESLSAYKEIFRTFSWLSSLIFATEYAIRIKNCKGRTEKIHYLSSPWGILDLLAILPNILGLITQQMQIFKVLQLIKVYRSYLETHESPNILEIRKTHIVTYCILFCCATIFAGDLLYLTEGTQIAFRNIPIATMQACKLILGLSTPTLETSLGETVGILTKITSWILFCMLIPIVKENLRDSVDK